MNRLKGVDVDPKINPVELAKVTNCWTGADLMHLVQAANARAITRSCIKQKGEISKWSVTQDDFMYAMTKVKPLFGSKDVQLKDTSQVDANIYTTQRRTVRTFFHNVQPQSTQFLLVAGDNGTGRTSFMCHIFNENDKKTQNNNK
eukprot:UN26312